MRFTPHLQVPCHQNHGSYVQIVEGIGAQLQQQNHRRLDRGPTQGGAGHPRRSVSERRKGHR